MVSAPSLRRANVGRSVGRSFIAPASWSTRCSCPNCARCWPRTTRSSCMSSAQRGTPRERREILRLREYPEDSAGAMMTTEVAMIDEKLTVRQAIDELTRAAERLETIYYIYAVDEDQRLDGVVTARQLLTALKKPEMRIADLMESDLIFVETTADRNEVTNQVAKYDLHAIPVVDERCCRLGIITHDDVIEAVRHEASEEAKRRGAVVPSQE